MIKCILPLIFFVGLVNWNCGNTAPVISSLSAEPETITMGGTVTLTCKAHDAEEKSFTYAWDCADGTIIGDGNTATWTAPDVAGIYSIACEVMDSNHGSAIETIDIIVS